MLMKWTCITELMNSVMNMKIILIHEPCFTVIYNGDEDDWNEVIYENKIISWSAMPVVLPLSKVVLTD